MNLTTVVGISELGKACTRDNNPEANFTAKTIVPSCTYDAVPAVGLMTRAEPSGQPVCLHEPVWSALVGTQHWTVCSVPKLPDQLLAVAEDLHHYVVAQ
jgi:hypothetical protein